MGYLGKEKILKALNWVVLKKSESLTSPLGVENLRYTYDTHPHIVIFTVEQKSLVLCGMFIGRKSKCSKFVVYDQTYSCICQVFAESLLLLF